MTDEAERNLVVAAARRTATLGLTHGTSGNVSCRTPDGMLITPSGISYDGLESADVVAMALDGTIAPGGRRRPSSEWRIHARLYQARPDAGAVVHGHSPAASAVACLGRGLPSFHYMIAIAGGDSVPGTGYALFGTEALAALAAAAMRDRWACLLAHHGLLAAGTTLDHAMAVAAEVEFLADLYLRLLPLGEPARLDPEQMRAVIDRFRSYGQPG
ncbi:MAG: class II aldolase [Gemmatimonadetes bacterium]|nr:class II aldolase [Gemmatimonadota bacterium]